MKNYSISVIGCDDSTDFDMLLTAEEYAVILSMALLCNKTSTYDCMPRIRIELKGGDTVDGK